MPNQWCAAVIFDLDGLLIDSEPLWHRAEIEVFGRHGVELTVAMCRSTKGRFVGEVTQYWYDRIGWAGPSPAAVADAITDRMEQLLSTEVAVKPAVPEVLSWCRRQGLPMAVASSSSHRLIAAALGRHRLQGWFDAICSVDDVGVGKPDPAVFLFAAEALGVAANRCLVLEDSPTGAVAALAARMACVMVPELPDTPCPHGVAAVLGSLADLPGAWEALAQKVSGTPSPSL